MKAATEQSTVEGFDNNNNNNNINNNVEKEKKKKRRSNRRSKQNPTSSSANEICSVSSEFFGDGTAAPTPTASPMKQQGDNAPYCYDHQHDDTTLVSIPAAAAPMHINEQSPPQFVDAQTQDSWNGWNGDLVPSPPQIGFCPQRCYFSPHWPMEAVEMALEKGDVFKASFRVNAHNRLEAYCKVDGLPTDVLISGIPAQNRAVEGDIVAITMDSFSSWTKMKGSNRTCNNYATPEDCSLLTEADDVAGNIYKGKGELDKDKDTNYDSADCRNRPSQNQEDTEVYPNPNDSCHFPEKKYAYEDSGSLGPVSHLDPVRPANDSFDGQNNAAFESLNMSSCSKQIEVISAVQKMCSLVNAFPSKRPTARVVAIIEKSPRRERIVGQLNVKQWISVKGVSRKDAKKNKNLVSDNEYIQLTPIDPKFPKMMLFVRDLPEHIKKRLQSGDVTTEMDLIAAQLYDWGEESLFPRAHILHVFGKGSKVQTHLDAILFQNTICESEFSPEAMTCLPCFPWEVPEKELQSRLDLRNLCIFTIDPSTATDLDDALSIEKLPNGNCRVGVHIADVSYFVLPGTVLDDEAQFRSTTVYMLQKKIPMLPALFSDNIGSLNPGVDRVAVSMLLDINPAGDVVNRWIGRSVIQSCCKLSYELAQNIIDGAVDFESSNIIGESYPKVHGQFGWPDIITSVKSLCEISNVLKQKRFNDGALRLENPKVAFLFDEYGLPYDLILSERKESNFLVEEFMLLANTTAAEVICRVYPDNALLRRHPEPNMRKLRDFVAFCQKHGLKLDTSSSGQFHRSLELIKEKLKDDSVLFDILISYATRPMQLACYFCSGQLKERKHEWGHYALAVPFYTHFTSPLRRYPDIVVHRTLLAALEAEELYLKHRKALLVNKEEELQRCFTGIIFDKNAAESVEGREALSAAASKHGVPSTEILADVAAYCNERKLASRNVKDACDKLYMWHFLKKEILLSEARVLGLGPRFMSIYIQKLAIEQRIYYDEVEGLSVEWLEATSSVVLSMSAHRRAFRRGSHNKWRAFEEVAFVVDPYDLKVALDGSDGCENRDPNSRTEIDPAVFPLTVHLLSTIPVVLHAVGGDDGPLEIGVRLYMSSYYG
ncbi:DIS3-like exonuclease 2 [Arachis duranensis]|uniref:DIS3-like exonuclease 2 n=1 Tax=Arachis duranensis TaxID=130453 RepID=A0A6P4BSW6_ARADU|nr:DIS3-like exonuclease 2 [Arachis duranensis]